MDSIETLTRFLAWCTTINFGLLIVATIVLTTGRGWIVETHKKMIGLDEPDLLRAYFRYLASYKILIIVFNLAPYLALRIIG